MRSIERARTTLVVGCDPSHASQIRQLPAAGWPTDDDADGESSDRLTQHSMSTALGENELLVDLCCDNLRRYLAGTALRNVFDRERGH
jgi:hypothetical protein